MRRSLASLTTRITLLTHVARSATSFSVRPAVTVHRVPSILDFTATGRQFGTGTALGASGGGGGEGMPQIRQIGKADMAEILEDYEAGRAESGYVVMDVRGEDEVMYTGKVSPSTITLPLPIIMAQNVFALDDEEFEEICGFEKPALDETLVFTCAAGIRSQHAAVSAAQAGYSNLVNYSGGANEWFL